MAQEGILLISDITGYTTYLHDSELEHAQDSLAELLKLLIDQTRTPLVIAKIEGDAVFSYAPENNSVHGQTLLEMIEITYATFRKALDLMVLNTTCTCRACRNLPNLDLKFFVHYGQFSIQDLGAFSELAGKDVNLIHRLTKNQISEATGFKAYASYTQQVIDALDMGSMTEDMFLHTEEYSDVGDITVHVTDMHEVWKRREEDVRISVEPEDAMVEVSQDFPVPPPLLWDYITKPEYRIAFYNSTAQEVSTSVDGRIGDGSVYVCYHGEATAEHIVLDWRPFDEYTTRETWPLPGVTCKVTYRISAIDSGSRLDVLSAPPEGPLVFRYLLNIAFKLFFLRKFKEQTIAFRQYVENHIAQFESGINHTIHNL